MKRMAVSDGFVGARLGCLLVVVMLLAAALTGCRRDPGGQLPAVTGEAIQAQRQGQQGFALVAAFPDQKGDEAAE